MISELEVILLSSNFLACISSPFSLGHFGFVTPPSPCPHELACTGHITAKKDRLRESWHWSRLGTAVVGRRGHCSGPFTPRAWANPKCRLDFSLTSVSCAQKYHFSHRSKRDISMCQMQLTRGM